MSLKLKHSKVTIAFCPLEGNSHRRLHLVVLERLKVFLGKRLTFFSFLAQIAEDLSYVTEEGEFITLEQYDTDENYIDVPVISTRLP